MEEEGDVEAGKMGNARQRREIWRVGKTRVILRRRTINEGLWFALEFGEGAMGTITLIIGMRICTMLRVMLVVL